MPAPFRCGLRRTLRWTCHGTALWFHYACGLEKVRPNSMSQMNAVQLYRPQWLSVRKRCWISRCKSWRKLTFCPVIHQRRSQPANAGSTLISRFVAKARTVVPKGEVILTNPILILFCLKMATSSIFRKNIAGYGSWRSAVPERGELAKGMTTEDYIEKCGGLTQKSGTPELSSFVRTVQPSTRKMWITQAGRWDYGSAEIWIEKHWVTRGISTILYQLAVGAKVILLCKELRWAKQLLSFRPATALAPAG